MPKKRKKREKKTYDIKKLKEKWKQQRFDKKKYFDKMKTIVAGIAAIVLAFFAVLMCFVVGIYEPIDKEEATAYSVQFEYYSANLSRSGAWDRYIKSTTQERIDIPDSYVRGEQNIENDLRKLEPNTTLYLKAHNDGTVLEIRTEHKEILNFDYAQKQLQKSAAFWFIVGVLSFLGAVACTIYTMIKIIKYKAFAPSKNIY